MTTIVLRDYQHRSIADLRAAYASGKRAPCLVLPCGGGKTLIAAEIIRAAVSKQRRVLVLAHRYELLTQTVSKLEQAGVTNVRLIQASNDFGDPMAPVTVASVPTLTMPRWLERLPPADLVVCDEAHHFVATTFCRIPARYPDAHVLGMTATPQRSDGAPLGDMFDALVIGSTVKELTELGHLVACRVWAPPSELDSGQTALGVGEAYDQHGNGERAVVFCSSREHAAEIVASMSVPAAVVHGSLPMLERTRILAAFRAGAIRVVVNVHVLTEGFDDPAIGVCILARKMGHAGTFLQAVGRVLRPAPGKRCATLIDLCGSVLKHGTPEAERTFSLDGKGITKSDREPIRQCPTCGGVFIATADGICPQCGTAMPRSTHLVPRSVGVGLVEVPASAPRPPPTISMVSKFRGACRVCCGTIHVGDRIRWSKGTKPRHEHCGPSAMDEANALMRGIA